jgi:hypothetical protein
MSTHRAADSKQKPCRGTGLGRVGIFVLATENPCSIGAIVPGWSGMSVAKLRRQFRTLNLKARNLSSEAFSNLKDWKGRRNAESQREGLYCHVGALSCPGVARDSHSSFSDRRYAIP